MRTSIFNNFANMPKEFREDFEILWELPEEIRTGLIAHVPKMSNSRTTRQKKIAMDDAIKEVGGSPDKVLRALKILEFIYDEWNPFVDTTASFLKDLGELALIPVEKAEEAKTFLLEFLGAVEENNTYRLEKMFAAALLPNLTNYSTAVDFRAIISKPFRTGLNDDIGEYQPTCIGFAPVIIVKLTRKGGTPATFEFQCEEDSLTRLIEELQAAKKDLNAAKRSLPDGG